MGEAKKYYWLKLKKDFFKRHDITVLEGMLHGEKMVLFYLKLMTESIDHNGRLRFSEEVPYSDFMLSSITHTDPDFACDAMDTLRGLGLVETLEDGTLFLPEVEKMMGYETSWAEKKRNQRERGQSEDNVPQMSPECPSNVPEMSPECPTRDKSIEIRDKNNKKSIIPPAAKHPRNQIPPTIEMVRAYCEERQNGISPEDFMNHYTKTGWMSGRSKIKDWQAAVREWERRRKDFDRPKPKPNSMTLMQTNPTDLDELEKRIVAN